MSTAQAGMIRLIMPDQSVAQQQAQQARETIICTCGGVWWSHALRRLQAATGLGMQHPAPLVAKVGDFGAKLLKQSYY